MMWLSRVTEGWPLTLVTVLFAVSNAASSLALNQQCRRPHFWEVGCCVHNECPVEGESAKGAQLQPGCTLLGDLSSSEFDATTVTYADAKSVHRPVCEITDFPMERVVGYYDGASARRHCQSITPFALPRGLYTHLNFAFATIDPKTFEVLLSHRWDYILYRDMVALKKYDGNLKVFLSIGSWNHDSKDGSSSVMTTFSQLAASEKSQKKFFKSLVSLMNAFGFDGVDIHWPYPGQTERGGQAQDFDTFPRFIESLKLHLDKKAPKRNGLSVAVPLQLDTLKHFDVLKLQPNVDFFNMLSSASEDEIDGRKSLTLKPHADLRETQASIDLLWEQGLDPAKITLGVTFQVKTAVLEDDGCTSPGCPSRGPGTAKLCSNTFGSMLRAEAENDGHLLSSTSGTAHFDQRHGVKYFTKGKNWFSYEDSDTWQLKTNLARSQCLGGIMVWSLGHDDEDGQLSKKLQKLTEYDSHHPLMHNHDEDLSYLQRLSPANQINKDWGRGTPTLYRENPGLGDLMCHDTTTHDLSASILEILCKDYPKRSLRKVSSVPDYPQVPGGYNTPYGLKRVQHPEGTQPARNTTSRCGRWHLAAEGDAGKTLLQLYDLDMSLLLSANPSINEHNIHEPLVTGEAYCVAPIEGHHLHYQDIGCYYNINREVMPVSDFTTIEDPSMTVDKCAKICMLEFRYTYFGLKNGRICMCGVGVHYETTKVKDKYCNKPCGGDAGMMCGGKKYTRLYSIEDKLRVISSPKNDKPQFGRGFGRSGGGCGGGMKDAWGGPGV